MDVSLISEMKAMAEENRRLKRMFASFSMQADLLKEALGNMERPAQRRELVVKAVAMKRASIAFDHCSRTVYGWPRGKSFV